MLDLIFIMIFLAFHLLLVEVLVKLLKEKGKFIINCGNGAVYFGWFGNIGIIALTAGKWNILGRYR